MTPGLLTIIWGILFVILVVVEIATMGLTTIWFAFGSLLAVILAALNAPLWLQIIVFIIVSLVLLFFTRPIALKYFNNARTKTNAESLVGEIALVTEAIDNLKGQGTVFIHGQEWSARTANDDHTIGKDFKVRICEIQGVKLIVEPASYTTGQN